MWAASYEERISIQMVRRTNYALLRLSTALITLALFMSVSMYYIPSTYASIRASKYTLQSRVHSPIYSLNPLNLSNEAGTAEPAGVSYTNTLYIAWTGADQAHHLNLTNSGSCSVPNDSCFTNVLTFNSSNNDQTTLAGQGESLAVFSYLGVTRLYMAWLGGDGRLNLENCGAGRSCLSSTQWLLSQTILSQTSHFRPSIAAWNNQLYIAWTGTNGLLNIASASDGAHFSNIKTFSDSSILAPSLTVFNSNLYITWIGGDSNHSVNVAQFNGTNLINKSLTGQIAVDDNLGTCAAGGNFYVGTTTGLRPGSFLWYQRSGDARTWSSPIEINGTPSYGAGYANFSGSAYILWTDVSGNILRINKTA